MTAFVAISKSPRIIVFLGGVLLVVLLLAGTYWRRTEASLPVAAVKRTEFVDYVEIRGQVKARRSEMMTAPAGVGDLQILRIAANGSKVKKGDALVEFDASTLKQKYAQDLSTLRAAEAEIEKAAATARMQEEQDLTDSMKTKFATDSAKMDASKEEILSRIEGAEARIKVSDAEQKYTEANVKLKANRSAKAADVATKRAKRDAAESVVKQDEAAVASLVLRAPIDGLVVLQGNWRSTGGMAATEAFKPGDRVWSGAALIELPDPSALRIVGRIDEVDRGRAKLGQPASIRIDAIPDRSFSGKVDEISATASLDFTGGWPFLRNFTVGIALEDGDSRLTPGMGAVARVAVDRVANAIVIPTAAIFRKAGVTVVYVRRGSRFIEFPVEVRRRGSDEALIVGDLKNGDQVALKDPAATE